MVEPHLLVVEDDVDIRDLLKLSLQSAGYRVATAGSAHDAYAEMEKQTPDLILLDWMLPEVSGIEILRRLRRNPALEHVPVIMLTARGDETDRVRGLDSGADDYLPKPFSNKELLARIRALLRRSVGIGADDRLEADGVTLDAASHRVLVCGDVVKLGPTEFRLLHFFMSHPDRVYSRAQLLDKVWGINVYVEERTVDVHIRRLRKALESYGKEVLVQTVRGVGYRFSAA